MSWLFYKRGTILPYLADIPLSGVNQRRLHPLGVQHPRTFYINEGEKLYWAWEEDDMVKMWKRLIILLKSPRATQAYFRKLDYDIAVALRFAARVKQRNLQKLSDKDLLVLFGCLEKEITPAHFTMNSEIDVIDLYFEKYLRSKISAALSGLSLEQAEEVYLSLTRPGCHTYVNRQEIAVLQAASRHDFTDPTIKKIYSDFWWTNMGWENIQPHSLAYFRSLVKKQVGKRNLHQVLEQATNFVAANRRLRQKYLRKYHLGVDIKYWLWICDKYIFYHDRRKEVQVKTAYSFYLLLTEIARRFGYKLEDLTWLWHREVKDILRGRKADKAEIARRQKGVAALVYFNKFEVWSGQKAISLRHKYVEKKKSRPSEFRGVGVTSKIVRGRVKVCAGVKEAAVKMKTGDILVCSMTAPDYVPSMKKAKAVITDEGGITCHAAIIARELKIPCVVGTKIATQVLRDGDLVEVDAKKGTIKLIK